MIRTGCLLRRSDFTRTEFLSRPAASSEKAAVSVGNQKGSISRNGKKCAIYLTRHCEVSSEVRISFSKVCALCREDAQASPFSAPSRWATHVKLQIACSNPLPLVTPAKARLPQILN